jgi:hypothetical protein
LTESIYDFHKENGRTYHAYRAGGKFDRPMRNAAGRS